MRRSYAVATARRAADIAHTLRVWHAHGARKAGWRPDSIEDFSVLAVAWRELGARP